MLTINSSNQSFKNLVPGAKGVGKLRPPFPPCSTCWQSLSYTSQEKRKTLQKSTPVFIEHVLIAWIQFRAQVSLQASSTPRQSLLAG